MIGATSRAFSRRLELPVPRDRFEVTVEVSFAASHQLRGYKADLEPLHGHNFRVEAFVEAETLPDAGYVIDFLELETTLQEVVTPYDHRHMKPHHGEHGPFLLSGAREQTPRGSFSGLHPRLGGPDL